MSTIQNIFSAANENSVPAQFGNKTLPPTATNTIGNVIAQQQSVNSKNESYLKSHNSQIPNNPNLQEEFDDEVQPHVAKYQSPKKNSPTKPSKPRHSPTKSPAKPSAEVEELNLDAMKLSPAKSKKRNFADFTKDNKSPSKGRSRPELKKAYDDRGKLDADMDDQEVILNKAPLKTDDL